MREKFKALTTFEKRIQGRLKSSHYAVPKALNETMAIVSKAIADVRDGKMDPETAKSLRYLVTAQMECIDRKISYREHRLKYKEIMEELKRNRQILQDSSPASFLPLPQVIPDRDYLDKMAKGEPLPELKAEAGKAT